MPDSPKSPIKTTALERKNMAATRRVDTKAMTTEEYWALAAASNAQLKQELMNVHEMAAPALLDLLEDDNPRTALLESVVEFRQKSAAAAKALVRTRSFGLARSDAAAEKAQAKDLPDVVENAHTAGLQKSLSEALNVRDQALAQVMELKRDLSRFIP